MLSFVTGLGVLGTWVVHQEEEGNPLRGVSRADVLFFGGTKHHRQGKKKEKEEEHIFCSSSFWRTKNFVWRNFWWWSARRFEPWRCNDGILLDDFFSAPKTGVGWWRISFCLSGHTFAVALRWRKERHISSSLDCGKDVRPLQVWKITSSLHSLFVRLNLSLGALDRWFLPVTWNVWKMFGTWTKMWRSTNEAKRIHNAVADVSETTVAPTRKGWAVSQFCNSWSATEWRFDVVFRSTLCMFVIFVCGFESHIQIATFPGPINVVTSTRPGTSDGCGLGGEKNLQIGCNPRNLEHRFVCGMILSIQNELCTASKCKHYANISSRVLYIKRKNPHIAGKFLIFRVFVAPCRTLGIKEKAWNVPDSTLGWLLCRHR